MDLEGGGKKRFSQDCYFTLAKTQRYAYLVFITSVNGIINKLAELLCKK